VPIRFFRAAFAGAFVVCLIGTHPQSVTLARSADRAISASTEADAEAMRELLEGKSGRRETWVNVPALVVLTSVMEYRTGDMVSGYVTTDERLADEDTAQLVSDLTRALDELTGGAFKAFAAVRFEKPKTGQIVRVFRSGQIVVGRFRGVQAKTGSLGYGARTTRNGTITAAAVIVDRNFDRDPNRRLMLRTHELGHALGYNHVESRPSVMNPRVGTGLTEFDRAAIKVAFNPPVQQ